MTVFARSEAKTHPVIPRHDAPRAALAGLGDCRHPDDKSETPSQGAAETIRAGTRDEHMAYWRDHSCVVGASRRTWRGIGAGELSQSAGAHRHSLFAGKRGRRV